MLFTSDNWAGVHPQIMDALVAANQGTVPAYGNDDVTADAVECFKELFGPCSVFFVATGSAANALALSSLLPPYGAVLCYQNGHIHLDECGAPEFFTGGAKVLPIDGEDGKLTPEGVTEAMRFFTPAMTHHVVPGVLSLTQATEAGTIYTVEEIGALVETARQHALRVHMDGARFANACVAMGDAPQAFVSDAGVDILTLGGTKNGCMVAEAIVCFDDTLKQDLAYRQKRAGQGFSKGRFLSAQWSTYFKDDLWLVLAGSANAQAQRLAEGLSARGFPPTYRTEINEVFVVLPDDIVSVLKERGAAFYDWVQPRDPFGGKLRRLVTSFVTQPEEVDAFLAVFDSVG